uniref:Zinc finger protein n=1 Tax=Rhipicephalus appendiculatus TaxID=34631 RepID=A0A131YZ94_RHIAP
MTIKVFLEATPLVVDLEFPEGIQAGGCLTIILTSPGQKLAGEDKQGIQFSHVNDEIIPVVRTVTVEDDLAACIQTLQKVKIEATPLASGKLPCIVRLAPKVYSEKEASTEQELSFPPIGKVLDCLPGSPTMFPAGSPDESEASSAEEDDDLDFEVPPGFGDHLHVQPDIPELPTVLGSRADSPIGGTAPSPSTPECMVCNYSADSADDLRYHVRLHAVQGELCCKLCQQQFRTLVDFKEHCDSHGPKPVQKLPRRNPAMLSCGACGKLFRSQAWLERHIEQRHGGDDTGSVEGAPASQDRGPPTLQCCACARTFASASALQAHERSHYEAQPGNSGDHACSECERSFSSYRGLRMHQRRHDRCQQTGRQRATTEPVIETVTAAPFDTSIAPTTPMDGETVFSDAVMVPLQSVGDECGDSSTEAAAVTTDIEMATEDSGNKEVPGMEHACPLCGKTFERALKRDHHVVRKHTKAYPLQCTMCRRGFMFRKNLDRHFQDAHSSHYMVTTAPSTSMQPETASGTRQTQFKCNYCAYTGSALGDIQAHLSSHPEIRFYACDRCDKEFSSEVRYQRHMERRQCRQRPQCDECGKCLSSQTALRNHRLCHGQDRGFSCDQCGESFKTSTTLKYHQQAKHGANKAFKCEHCSKGFNFLAQKKRHVSRVHLRQTNHACTMCPMRFMTRRELMLHLLCGHKFQPEMSDKGAALMPDGSSAPSLKLFRCEHCDYVSYSRKGYLRHLVDHTGVWPFACDLCSKGFIERNQAERHIRTAHTSESYPCPQCPRVFVLPSSFQDHLQAHEEHRGSTCSQCAKYFETQGLYDLHLQAHSRDLHYRCHTCGQGFNKIASLNFHTIVHKHEKAGPNTWSHACDVCKKRFKYPGSLAAHRYRHSQETRFKCDLCQVTLHSEGVFEAHMRRHRGEKPFKCTFCDKAFTLAMSQRHHITRFHTGDYHIFCPLCNKGVVSNKMLRRHLFHVHSTVLRKAVPVLEDSGTSLEVTTMDDAAVLATAVEEEDSVVELHPGEADDALSVADDGTLTVTLPADALLLGAVESVQGVETVVETVQFQ